MLHVVFALIGCEGEGDLTAGPNVVLITIDTLRADHVGAWGYARPITPHLDALAASGVRFEAAFSAAGLTAPALMSLHTSLPPARHGVRLNVPSPFDPALPSLGGTLCTADRDCGAFLTNSHLQRWPGIPDGFGAYAEDGIAVDRARAWLRAPERSTRPFFLWVHLWGPHAPYEKHAEGLAFADPTYRGEQDGSLEQAMSLLLGESGDAAGDVAYLTALYDGEILRTDAQVGRLLEVLRERGLAQRTLVVVTADHGEELYDHPPMLYHAFSGWDGVLRVPLVLSQPGSLPSGKSVDDAVGLQDVAPTILALLGHDRPATWEGRSLTRALAGDPLSPEPVYSEVADRAVVVHDETYAAIFNPTGGGYRMAPKIDARREDQSDIGTRLIYAMPRAALYDWRVDPTEQRDLAAARPKDLARLGDLVKRWSADVGWPGSVPATDRPAPAVRARLESLGYATP